MSISQSSFRIRPGSNTGHIQSNQAPSARKITKSVHLDNVLNPKPLKFKKTMLISPVSLTSLMSGTTFGRETATKSGELEIVITPKAPTP